MQTQPVELAASNFPIRLSDKAQEMARAALNELQGEEGEYLRVSVLGGGCAGLKYGLNFVSDVDASDLLMQIDTLKVVIDPFSALQIEGTSIDYVENLEGAGFKFENPNARRACGCGSSFAA